jgi:hypothetical protein
MLDVDSTSARKFALRWSCDVTLLEVVRRLTVGTEARRRKRKWAIDGEAMDVVVLVIRQNFGP